MLEIVQRYGTSEIRRTQLYGLLQMRHELRELGVSAGFQWIDGSFSEDIESTEQRDPGDIDVVTFGLLPNYITDSQEAIEQHPNLFNPQLAKQEFSCDAYFVDMMLPAIAVHFHTCYWFGLFSHKKVSNLWKGMLLVPLESNDSEAFEALEVA